MDGVIFDTSKLDEEFLDEMIGTAAINRRLLELHGPPPDPPGPLPEAV